MAVFKLDPVQDPMPVHVRTPTGTGTTVHLADHEDKTLCGRTGLALIRAHHPARWWQDAEPQCLRCIQARDGKARVKREFR